MQKQFGGAESAYILIYRRKNLPIKAVENDLPYITKYVNEINESKELERIVYEDAKRHIQIYVDQSQIINIHERKLIENYEPLKSA